jgi:hypothetical protein
MNRRQQLAGLAIVAALMIALILRDVVEQVIIRPLIYLIWIVSVYYRYIPQPVLWIVLVLVLIYLSLGRLAGRLEPPAHQPNKSVFVRGAVDELALRIERKEGGIYFKWQIARTLGQIALEMQELRQHTRSKKLQFNDLTARPQVRNYLDSGLNTSFSDYPIPGGLPLRIRPTAIFDPHRVESGISRISPSTPFDGDISPVIDYLESEMENDDDLRRP